MEILYCLDEINQIAHKIIAQQSSKVLLFNGEMGVGKTTLIKKMCEILGVQETTSSPTFSLVNEYQTNENQIVYHFDFYRLKNETEALDMGVDEYLYSGDWCFIEWGENISNLIPIDHSVIEIKTLANGQRQLNMI